MSNGLAVEIGSSRNNAEAGLVLVANAAIALAFVGFVIRAFGFKSLHELIRRIPTWHRRNNESPELIVDQVRSALDRAVRYRVTPAMCLRRAAAAVCLLRLRGIPSALVIGIQRLPFAAHAWAEVNGRVVTEPPGWKNTYRVIETL